MQKQSSFPELLLQRALDVFVHYAEIKDDGSTNKFKMLYEGDRVEYTPASSGKGTQAKDVVKLSSGEARSE